MKKGQVSYEGFVLGMINLIPYWANKKGHKQELSVRTKDPKFKELQDYIGATSHNLLLEMGFDLTNYQVFITDLWVQEFSKSGGGHHTLHTHWNGHMSGFYFLKAT